MNQQPQLRNPSYEVGYIYCSRLLAKLFNVWSNLVQTREKRLFFTNLLVDSDDSENVGESDLWPFSKEGNSLLLSSGVSGLSTWSFPRAKPV